MEKWTLDQLEKSKGKKGITMQKVPHTFSTQSVYLTIESNESLPIHSTPADVLFYVVSGIGLLTIGSETTECISGSYIESPKNVSHGWENKSDEQLKILVIKLF